MLEKILKNPLWLKTKYVLENIKFFDGVSLYFIAEIFIKKLKQDDLQTMACAIAYNFTLSLFPGIIFLFTLIPYIPIDNLDQHIMTFMEESLPSTIHEFTASTIQDIVSIQRGGLMSFGFILALYLSKNGMLSIMTAFNRYYVTKDRKRNFLMQQLIATMLTILFVLTVFIAVIVLVLGNVTLNFMFDALDVSHEAFIYYFVFGMRFVVLTAMFLLIISLIYYFAPNVKKRFSFFSAGSFTATVLIILVSEAFSYYVNNFATYNKIYGSIGALLALMFFFYAISLIILIGFEINASIDKAKSESV